MAMGIEDIKKRLRAEVPFFACPAKSERIDLTNDQWAAIDWTDEERFRNAALPSHLWNRRQDDRPWPLCHRWRGDNAFGPRAGEGHKKYLPDLPILIRGRGIARWISAGDKSVVEVPKLKDFSTSWTPETLPHVMEFYERKPENPDFGKFIRWSRKTFLKIYAPSSIQKFSNQSYLVRDPHHVSWHRMIRRREVVGKTQAETGVDTVLFFRKGMRYDSADLYYIRNAFYLGWHWN